MLAAPSASLLYAGALCIGLGLIHSIMGEVRIFRKPYKSRSVKPMPYYGILRATWHVTTLLAIALGALFIAFSNMPLSEIIGQRVIALMVACFVLSGLLVLGCTRARHPGWIVLIIIGGLVALA